MYLNTSIILFPSSVSAESFDLEPNRGERKTLQPHETLDLQFLHAEAEWRFVIYQAHAQKNNVTLSLNIAFSYGYTDTGSNAAALVPFPYANTKRYYHLYLKSENNHSSFQTDVIAVPYENGGKFLKIFPKTSVCIRF